MRDLYAGCYVILAVFQLLVTDRDSIVSLMARIFMCGRNTENEFGRLIGCLIDWVSDRVRFVLLLDCL